MSNPEFTVGSDVEFFLNHDDTGWIPATGFNCAGTKQEPVSVGELGSYHRDNISVEIQPPQSDTPGGFMENGSRLYEAMREQFRSMNLQLIGQCAVQFQAARLKDIEEADEMGCEPDKCAYAGLTMPTASVEAMGTWRTGSGHIHIGGLEDMDEDGRRHVVKWMDILEGLFGKYYEARNDRTSSRRRRYYGQAGRYRMKDYGLEWRTPSNDMWLNWILNAQAPGLFASVYTATVLTRAGITVDSIGSPKAMERVRSAIDGSDSRGAMRRMYYWQDLLYEHDEVKAVIKQAGTKYGCRANLYSA